MQIGLRSGTLDLPVSVPQRMPSTCEVRGPPVWHEVGDNIEFIWVSERARPSIGDTPRKFRRWVSRKTNKADPQMKWRNIFEFLLPSARRHRTDLRHSILPVCERTHSDALNQRSLLCPTAPSHLRASQALLSRLSKRRRDHDRVARVQEFDRLKVIFASNFAQTVEVVLRDSCVEPFRDFRRAVSARDSQARTCDCRLKPGHNLRCSNSKE